MIEPGTRFEGEGIKGWLLHAEYFFEVGKIAVGNSHSSRFALRGKGRDLQWHQGC